MFLRSAIRVGVVLCVAIAVADTVGLEDTLRRFDARADANAVSTYRERTYPEWLAGSEDVMEDGRLWMPDDASYRVVLGRRASMGDARYMRDFLHSLLLPRRLTDSPSAHWVFCFGCDTTMLGGRYQVLSAISGLSFGRVRQ